MRIHISSPKTIINVLLIFKYFIKVSSAPDLAIVTNSIGMGTPHLLNSNVDYSRKVSVRVGDLLHRHAAAEAEKTKSTAGANSMSDQPVPRSVPNYSTALKLPKDNSWPPEDSDQFSRVDVNVFGEIINSAALAYLQPDLSVGTVKKLRVILGDNFDHSWMSTEPHTLSNRSNVNHLKAEQNTNLLNEIEKLNFSEFSDDFGALREYGRLVSREKQILKNWLVSKATCPINFVWRDLGNRFWPRWIRHGICKEKRSCSWPPGMQCRPSGSKSLRLLRWHCSKQTTAFDDRKRIRRQPASTISLQPSDSLYGSAGASFDSYHRTRLRMPELSLSSPSTGLSRKRSAREERRSKRVKRLVRMLSRRSLGYYCKWSLDQYNIQPECSCTCGA